MKKFLSLVLALCMVLSVCAFSAAVAEEAPMEIVILDIAANNHGVQGGWFGKIVKDKFNIELNIIAPQQVGMDVYYARVADGDLGDIVILEKADFVDFVEQGLIKDISAEYENAENLKRFDTQIKVFNADFGAVYGIPTEMTDTTPADKTADATDDLPMVRWDLFNAIGAPEVADIDGMLDVLAKIHEIHPTNEAGDPAYPFSLWQDWDNHDNMMGPANVVHMTTWYGEKLKESAILKADNTFAKITDKTASYYKIAKFINKAYQMGLVDPDSGIQDWNSVCSKISNGQVDLIWYSWERGFWNSADRIADGTCFNLLPVADQLYYTAADPYYGSGRVWGVGANITDEKYAKVMEFLDWYASDEAMMIQHAGLEGFNYEFNEEGKPVAMNSNALMDNLDVPEIYGGGGYQDGFNAINQWIGASICTNRELGEIFSASFWATADPTFAAGWREKYGANNAIDYMKQHDQLLASPSVPFVAPTDSADIQIIRTEVSTAITKYTWQMFFAEDDAAFEALWDAMVEEVEAYGYNELFDYDVSVYQPEVDAKIEAIANAQ